MCLPNLLVFHLCTTLPISVAPAFGHGSKWKGQSDMVLGVPKEGPNPNHFAKAKTWNFRCSLGTSLSWQSKAAHFRTKLIFNMRLPGNQVCLLQGSDDTSEKKCGRGWDVSAVRQDRNLIGIRFDLVQFLSIFVFSTRDTLRRPMASGPSAAFGCPERSAGWCGVVQQCHQLLPDRSCGSLRMTTPRRGSVTQKKEYW